jgi:uncharacterized membrane protein YhaH (DUF805 family)
MREFFRFWFTFEQAVTRAAYLRHGLGLMALKYSVDAILIGVATRAFWTPLDYLRSVPLLLSTRLAEAPPYVASVLALWTLPFLWIGISMTIRRLLDVGWSAWWSLLFFIPVVSYILMAVLSTAPSGSSRSSDFHDEPDGRRLPSSLLSMAAGAALGLALMWLGVLFIGSYGLAVFMGAPFVIGLVTAYLFRQRYPATPRETHEVVAMTVLLAAGSAFLVGFEGAVCLLMVAPLGLVIALMGGVVGRLLASWGEGPARGAFLIVVLWPGGAALEAGPNDSQRREVASSVVIAAPPEVVWQHVIAFPPIPEPESLLFRIGLAYPTHAEIVGSGVGAVRYCHFSTGPFVEPITAWEPDRRLAFDVAESPRPLTELSPWELAPPHLDGYLLPRAGEFRLVDLGGRTRLEGSTWYEQRLRPEGYWVVFSDFIISQIHSRVLNHIKDESERAARLSAGAP